MSIETSEFPKNWFHADLWKIPVTNFIIVMKMIINSSANVIQLQWYWNYCHWEFITPCWVTELFDRLELDNLKRTHRLLHRGIYVKKIKWCFLQIEAIHIEASRRRVAIKTIDFTNSKLVRPNKSICEKWMRAKSWPKTKLGRYKIYFIAKLLYNSS